MTKIDNMKIFIKLILFLSIFLLIPSKVVLAFDIEFKVASEVVSATVPEKITIDSGLISQWKKTTKITRRPQSFYESITLSSLFNELTGIKTVDVEQKKTFGFDVGQIYDWLLANSNKFATEAIEPKIIFENELVKEFNPGTEGLNINFKDSSILIAQTLETAVQNVVLDIVVTKPNKKLSEVNDLGIRELVARGESYFAGSPNNRRHNIATGVAKVSGIVVKPGEEFSFNKYLGPVEENEGFLPELVIKKTGTVPELGGGLCQVSSTLFRAAMKAGFPIVERRNHSYAVSYYAPQGTDATIYPGVVDMKFLNDSKNAILIWPQFLDKNTLVYDIYGTKDDRKVTLGKPVVFDKKEDGSMKAYWERDVEKDGKISHDKFDSIYQSPALFHKNEIVIGGVVVKVGTP
jgi:vancomycin resistance protein YoaR